MKRVEDFIDSVLSHGASRYDPVKAREYYLRTRELKGRRSASGLKGQKKKEAWAYTKNEVQEERKQALEKASLTNQAATKQLRDKATARREEISAKLTELMERLSKESKEDRKSLEGSTKRLIEALPEMPKGLNKEQRAEFAEKRRKEIADIRGEVSKSRERITSEGQQEREKTRESSSLNREAVSFELKTSLKKAQDTYKKAKEGIKAKYESELDKEYESIRTLKKK